MRFLVNFFRKKIVYFFALVCLILIACDSPEKSAENHLKKGKEYLGKGELEKAILELKTASQESNLGETYYYMAMLDERQHNYKSERQNLLVAIELEPELVLARLKLIKVDILLDDLDNGLKQLELILNSNPENIDAKLLKAYIYIKKGENFEADIIINAIRISYPDNLEAIYLKSIQDLNQHNIDQALATVDIGLKKDSANIPLRMQKIKINSERKNIDAVIEDYKEFISLYPENVTFKLNLINLYSYKNKLQEAEKLIRQLIDNAPEKIAAKLLLLEFLNDKAKERVTREFNQWLDSNQLNSKNLLAVSSWMISKGYEQAALNAMQHIVDTEKISPLGLTAKTVLAEAAINHNQYDQADSLITAILGVDSDFIDASLLKARLLLRQGEADEAIALLNKLIWSKNKTDEVYFLLGEAYASKNDSKQAEQSYKFAIEKNPVNLSAFFQIYYIYLNTNRTQSAQNILDRSLKYKPNHILLLGVKAEFEITEKKWNEAEATVQRLDMLSNDKFIPSYLQANILQGKKKFTQAVDLYEKLLVDHPGEYQIIINLVKSYEGMNSREKAIALLENLHANNPEDPRVISALSEIYLANQNYAKAKQLIAEQLIKTPHVVPLYIELARIVSLKHENSDGTKDIYLKGLENNPGDQSLLLALAGWYEQSGMPDKAKDTYESLLTMHPKNEIANNNLAILLLDSPKNEEVQRGGLIAEKFKESINPYFQDTYAWALLKAKKTSYALKLLESLATKEPKSADIMYHLGVAHFSNGDKSRSISDLKQAISLSESQRQSFSWKNNAKYLLHELDSKEKN